MEQITNEIPIANSSEFWNYLKVFKYFLENNKVETIEEVKELLVNNFILTNEEIESLSNWAINLKYKLYVPLSVIKREGDTKKYYLGLAIPEARDLMVGEGEEFIEKLQNRLPENIQFIEY